MLLELLATDAVTYLFPTIPETDADDPTQSGMAINGDRAYPTISLSGGGRPRHIRLPLSRKRLG